MKKYLLLILICTVGQGFAQTNPKSVKAYRISEAPSIDGLLNEDFWKEAEPAKDFVMYEPSTGIKETEQRKTVVKIAYDDQAIYFGAILYDEKPSEIPMQFSTRDEIGQVDYFQVNINPNNDGQNDTEFIVMSTGVQADAKAKSSGGFGGGNFRRKDFSWSGVWYSKVTKNENSWVVEMKIPYFVLRFANTEVQTWGINFIRKMHKHNEQYSWNLIDRTKGNYTQYAGELTGIENVKPPTRLSFSPYASTAYTTYDGDKEFDYSVGMDLKYGISESFTLDATLIPDFGQTAFDDQVLNLGPFEQRYAEQRSFFTEGTELFNKGRMFYSRRIGNAPVGSGDVEDTLGDNEEIIDNPSKVNMLNAVKVSGRTKKGLGVGVFNAITERTYAKIRNLSTDEVRRMVTEPLANYSVLVLDQEFNKNSSVSLVNTNVLREGSFRDANVTGLLFDLSDKGNNYNLSGSVKTSSVREDDDKSNGYSLFIMADKTSGNYQYGIGHWRANDTYDIRDLGFQRRNNYANYFANASYQIFEPTKHFNSMRFSVEGSVRYQNEPYEYATNNVELDAFFLTKKRVAFGVDFETNIGDQYDFYEPRVEGRFFKQNPVFESGAFYSTDYRKKFAYDIRANYAFRYDHPGRYHALNISPRYRFSDKFELIYAVEFSKLINEKGWVNELDNGDIIFGTRDVKNVVNTISSKLSFDTKSSLALSFRHYWSPVTYENEFFSLNDEGTLDPSDYSDNHNINYNIWNLDLSYAWEFAPGSQLVALYRNAIFNSDDLSHLKFGENLDNLFAEPGTNNISLKFIYFLDYNKLKSWL